MALIDKLKAIADGFRASRGTEQEYSLDEMAVLAAEKVGGGSDGSPVVAENVVNIAADVRLHASPIMNITANEIKATTLDKYNGLSTGFSTATYCRIDGSSSWVYRALLQHDLSMIPAESTIMSAKLKVYVSSGNDNYKNSQCYVGRLLSEWEESSADWTNQPEHISYSNGSSETPKVLPPSSVPSWLEIDITPIVRQWCSGAVPNHGIVIRAITEGEYRYNWDIYNRRQSEEYATRVDVKYYVPID